MDEYPFLLEHLNFTKDTPKGFRFLTNLSHDDGEWFDLMVSMGRGMPETNAEYIAKLRKQYGSQNVVVTTPAYTCDGEPWNGMAVHIRGGEDDRRRCVVPLL